ncbi:MAG: NAD-dependent epimerase/dehydratase family protein [Micropepsaceae bacterium]
MSGLTVVLGFGAVGRATIDALRARGDAVCIAQRSRPVDLPTNVDFRKCDVLEARSVAQAITGARQVVLAVGFAYDARVWRRAWPIAMTNVTEACAASGARVVFVDNLYMLGPQREPRREDMPLTNTGEKPAILSQVTRIWTAAAKAGRVRIAALRCTDFYGPGVVVSHLGSSAFGAMANSKPALMLAPLDTPHDFAYVPDIARAVISLLDAPDEDFGQVWNMPCAPTLTPRQILSLGAAALNVKLRVRVIPLWSLPLLGLFSRFLREVSDVGFTWDRPYVVDGTKFTRRFWSNVTPYAVGVPATALSFLPRQAPGRATLDCP